VAIPNVVGQKLSDAQAALTAAGFVAKVGGGASPDDIVQAMDPGAGTAAKAGTQVNLTVQKSTPTPGPGAGG
jgi:beta-lactam-binding protein with PASTA domain